MTGSGIYNGFAGFPGMAPSGYLTTTNAGYATPAPAAAASNTSGGGSAAGSSPFASYNTSPAAASGPTNGSYVNASGVPIYYGGANATAGTAAATTSASGGPSTASYYNAAGVPIYYGGANATASSPSASNGFSGYATTAPSNSYVPTGGTTAGYNGYTAGGGATTGYGSAGYYAYGNGSSSGSYSGVSTMITFCGSGSRC